MMKNVQWIQTKWIKDPVFSWLLSNCWLDPSDLHIFRVQPFLFIQSMVQPEGKPVRASLTNKTSSHFKCDDWCLNDRFLLSIFPPRLRNVKPVVSYVGSWQSGRAFKRLLSNVRCWLFLIGKSTGQWWKDCLFQNQLCISNRRRQ